MLPWPQLGYLLPAPSFRSGPQLMSMCVPGRVNRGASSVPVPANVIIKCRPFAGLRFLIYNKFDQCKLLHAAGHALPTPLCSTHPPSAGCFDLCAVCVVRAAETDVAYWLSLLGSSALILPMFAQNIAHTPQTPASIHTHTHTLWQTHSQR